MTAPSEQETPQAGTEATAPGEMMDLSGYLAGLLHDHLVSQGRFRLGGDDFEVVTAAHARRLSLTLNTGDLVIRRVCDGKLIDVDLDPWLRPVPSPREGAA